MSSAVTRYADAVRLDLWAKLDLFLGVADAVQSRMKSPGLAPAPANRIRSFGPPGARCDRPAAARLRVGAEAS